MRKFVLNEIEEERAKKFCDAIKEIYGEVGTISYIFTESGIGYGVDIYSKLLDKKKDITDYESW
jgi:hypothetical protein